MLVSLVCTYLLVGGAALRLAALVTVNDHHHPCTQF
jgi:hypothetical protein